MYIISAAYRPNPTADILYRTSSRSDAQREYQNKSQNINKNGCVVLYDATTDVVMNITIQCEPLYAVNAVEAARTNGESCPKVPQNSTEKKKTLEYSTKVISAMAGYLSGVTGAGSVIAGHIIAPYYAAKGDGRKAGAACAGMYGGLSGAVIGTVVGGPIGAIIGGLIGGAGMGAGADAIIEYGTRCQTCQMTGFVDDFRRCPSCKGLGHN